MLAAAAGFALAFPAAAVELGDIRVHSALGEPLDARFVIAAAPGADFSAGCLSVEPAGEAAQPFPAGTRFILRQTGGGWQVRLQTAEPVNEPALVLRFSVACDGAKPATRVYSLLFEPRDRLRTIPGDTLASLAHAIFPANRAARDAYVQALRAANPSVGGLRPGDPIPVDTALVVPDLRRFSVDLARLPAPATPVAPERAPQPAPARAALARRAAPSAAPPPPASAAPPPPASAAPSSQTPAAPPPSPPLAKAPVPGAAKRTPQRATPSARDDFVLRLSAPEIDLSRSRGIDERKRAQLRERLHMLDADDHVAELLATRENLRQLQEKVADLQARLDSLPPALKQLRGRVAELQLKLSAAPSAAPSTAPPAAAPVAASVRPPASPTPASPDRPAALPASSLPAAPATAASSPDVEGKPAPARPAPPAAKPPPATTAMIAAEGTSWLPWGGALAAGAFAGLLAYLAYRRRRKPVAASAVTSPRGAPPVRDSALARPTMPDLELEERETPSRTRTPVAPAAEAGPGSEITTSDAQAIRRRYIAQRFPEIAGGSISPGEPDSLLTAARLFYEDGDMPRAVELLQYAIEEEPKAMKTWLALFEILRLEGLVREFATLAARFREHHRDADYWRKVQFIGRGFEPENPLYRDAAGEEITFDPHAENWLNAPMDFTTDALAADLRAGIMADAMLREGDLIPNPMPALKNVEIFTVA